MQPANRYYKCSKLWEVKFRYLLRLFALDLTASDAARLTGLSVRAVNDVYLRLRHRLLACSPVPAEVEGAVELDESYFGPRRVRGKRGRGAGGKTIVFGLFKRGAEVYTEIVPDCSKKTLQAIIRGKVDVAAMVNTDGWRGYDGLVDGGFDRHFRVHHGQDEFVHGASHINGIESFWSFAKAHLQRFKGVAKHTFLLHLKEAEFRFSSLAVDKAQGVISHVQADLADSRDSLHLPRLLTGLQRRLGTHELRMRDLLADAGYANGPNYALLEAQGVTAWIPVFGHYKPEIAGFVYDRAADQYSCPAGKSLPFQKYATNQDGGWHKLYSAAYRDCQQCSLKATCVPKAQCKKLTKTIYDAAYRRAWQRQQTRRGQRLRRVRQSTVEPVFGNLLHHYGLRRMNVRGLAGAHKTMLLTAVAFNLKKLLRFRPQQHQSAVIALPRPMPTPDTRFHLLSRRVGQQNRPLLK